ncbi:serine protease inhibitor swm-1-like [Xylocopa sonorina]|uniref:serine protease inhibitor swm-1-like n=1 Tax=Xylocopa sonorina TaxID=1818115 RepID=UPI00403ABBE0
MSRSVTVLLLLAVVFALYQTETGAESESTPRCPVNQTWWTCGNLCEGKCSMPHNRVCPEICIIPGSCGCAANYYRDGDNNECVLLQDCP